MIELTYPVVLDLGNRAVADRGSDYVYETHDGEPMLCKYVHEGQPDCMVGWILAAAGLTLVNAYNRCGGSDDLLNHLDEHDLVNASEAARRFLRAVQSKQDQGYTWGESLAHGVYMAESADTE